MSASRMVTIGAAGFVVAQVAAPMSLLSAQGNADIIEDSAFVHDAAAGGLFEVRLGKLAHDRAASREVKQFGQLMETDHSKANQDLDAIRRRAASACRPSCLPSTSRPGTSSPSRARTSTRLT
jgi:predicted outer membrane protein